MKHHRPHSPTLAALAILTFTGAALGQVRGLDQGQFIEGLRKEGMNELLLHLVETEKFEPQERRQIEANQALLIAGNVNLPFEQREAALNRALDAQRALVKEAYDNPLRPIWQTDLAEMLLLTYLNLEAPRAAEFYEFGIPTAEQKKAFESVVAEALENCFDASERIFRLTSELPNHPQKDKYNTPTLRERLFKEYGERTTPFYLALSAYYTALLPETHPYYQSLGQNPRIPAVLQKTTPAEEKKRLLDYAISRLKPFVTGRDTPETLRLSALCLTGRAQLTKGDLTEAVDKLQTVVNANRGDLNDLLARFALAVALDRQGRVNDFQQRLADLAHQPAVKGDTGYRILLADLTHLALLRRARTLTGAEQTQATAAAYKPYEDLLNDRALDDSQKQLLKAYLYNRWSTTAADVTDPSALPTMVVVALGESYRFTGQGMVSQAYAGDKTEDQRKQELAAAKAKLEQAIAFNLAGSQRADATPAQKAQALYNLGSSYYFSNPQDNATIARAVETWLKLAQEMPDQPLAESAVTDALKLARKLHSTEPRPKGAEELYERAFRLLTTKYPTSKAADDEYPYYAFTILAPAGKTEEAIQYYDKVLPGHAWYFDAQGEALGLTKKLYDAAANDPARRTELTARLAQRAEKLRQEVQAALPKATDPEQIAALKNRDAYAGFILADLAMERKDAAGAIRILTDLETRHADNKQVVQLAVGKRIMALAMEDRIDEAQQAAKQMMAQYPESAAPIVNDMLTLLDQQVDALRKRLAEEQLERVKNELREQVKRRAKAALTFARLLHEWAVGQKFSDAQMLPINVVLAKSLRLSDKPEEALALLKPIYENKALARDAELIHNLAEAYFAVGAPAKDAVKLQEAVKLYSQLTRGLHPVDGKYPPMWWNAWLRSLQIRDILNVNTGEIPGMVDQLAGRDKDLGGDQFRDEFLRLKQKNLINRR